MNFDKKILLIINPVSGRREAVLRLSEIVGKLCKSGYIPSVAFTQKTGDARLLAAECPDDYEKMICAGGDGTLNEVISGLMQNESKFTLGYIPVGTTNDLASSLGLSKNISKAVKDIIEGHSVPIDIGCFNGRYFNYVASFGAFTDASYNAPQEVKNIIGHAAYFFEGIKSLGNIRPYHIKFEFNGSVIDDSFIFGAISNTTSLGGFLKLDDALVALNDGQFELLLIRFPESFQQFQQIVADLISQNFDNAYVKLYHTSSIKIQTNDAIDWTLDGELQHGAKKFTVENIQSAVNLIVAKPQQDKIAK